MHIRLEIEANSSDQLRRVLAEILGQGVVASATEFAADGDNDTVPATGIPIYQPAAERFDAPDAAPVDAAAPATEAPKTRGRKKAAATENPPPPPAPAGETSTTNETPPAPPAPPPADAPPPPANAPTTEQPANPASPATTAPPSPSPSTSAGEITVDSLRNLMASVMAAAPAGKGIPASTVQQALKAACGGIGSIAQMPPEQYTNAHAALSAL